MYLPLHFSLNPCHNYIYKIILLHLTQFLAGLHFMPLSDALPTACSCCVLSNKYRMTTHWCLLAIICYICRSFSLCNKVLSMLSDGIKVSSPDSVVAPATQSRPLDDRNTSISVYAASRSRVFRLSSKNGQSRFQDCPFILLIMRFFLACTDFCIN